MQRGRQPTHVLPGEEAGGVLVREGLDHLPILTLLVNTGNIPQRIIGELAPESRLYREWSRSI